MINIQISELIAAIESKNIGRLSACWLVVAHQQAQGMWRETMEIASAFGVSNKVLCAIEDHVSELPMTARTLSMDADNTEHAFLYYGFMGSPIPRRRVISLHRRGFSPAQIYSIGCDWYCGARYVNHKPR